MDTLHTYDELPYTSLPLPETQPDFVAAMAWLHGYAAPDPRCARVLELGCASGGNLIPLAFHHPESDYTGIELSRQQAESGARFLAVLGLNNARIVHADLAALPDNLGEFDYIIAHGVFSWVPPEVQQALLRVCRTHLAPKGLAYLSFNVSAGWQKLLPLREALLAETDASLAAPQRVLQAREILDKFETEWDDPLLLQEIAHLKAAEPSYLFHEFLAEHNAPIGFANFAKQLDGAGLRYVGEVGPQRAVVELKNASGLTPDAIATRWREAEVALDEVYQTRFRRALISRADAPRAQPPELVRLPQLAFYCDLTSDAEIDLDIPCEQDFIDAAGNRFKVSNPLLKAGLMALSAAYPAALRYADWLQAAHELMVHFEASGSRDEAELCVELFSLVIAHGVLVTVDGQGHPAHLPLTPQAHTLAHLQAGTPGWVVSGVRQVALGLDEQGRALLALLDGTRTVEELTQAMRPNLFGSEVSADNVENLIQQKIALFARQGLLHTPANI